nr:immunoglobulin heavy chain junction region [Mus musculus]MBK4186538.1 immunoglobulin heavy chain junction region [Mus musculus]MBK4186539.1 immunoglobulin heavy chain junction region [Mus musculus]MBK4186540.1 immunoglobulin heavy chain junction region [Mus musculus]MBK4186541.1 immunoglobulin heavy chain junction region [Mus musculus]
CARQGLLLPSDYW